MRAFMAPPPPVFRLIPDGSGRANDGGADDTGRPERRSAVYARRERAARAGACLLSVLVHALVVLAWPAASIPVEGLPQTEAARRAERAPLRAIALREPRASRRATSARPVPRVDARESVAVELPEIVARAVPTPRGPDLRRADAASREWTPPLLAEASDPAASSEEGEGYVRPIALSILRDWKPRTWLHGVEITVRVYTSAAGRATGLVELVPETPDRELNGEIVARVRELAYRPAQRDGEPVAAWAEITFVFCHKGIMATSPASPSGLADPCAKRVDQGARLASGKADAG